MLVLMALSPLLTEEAPANSTMDHGQVLRPVVEPILEKMKHMPHVLPGEFVAEELAGVIKRQIHNFRQKEGMTDASLLQKASEDLQNIRKRRQEAAAIEAAEEAAVVPVVQPAPGKRAGFVVLGMHRSGTSMLCGLLAYGNGYNVGGPLIGAGFDNEKGFFERIVSNSCVFLVAVASSFLKPAVLPFRMLCSKTMNS
jgi:hypothetical protein